MKKLTLLAVAFLIAAPGAQAQKLIDVYIIQAVASFAFLPISYAKAVGYYKAEGLNVTQIKTRGGGPDLVALLSGDVQFNVGAGTYQSPSEKFIRVNKAFSSSGELTPG